MSVGKWRSPEARFFDMLRNTCTPCEFHQCGMVDECARGEKACEAFAVFVENGRRPHPSQPTNEIYRTVMESDGCCINPDAADDAVALGVLSQDELAVAVFEMSVDKR